MGGFWGSHMGLIDLLLERDGNNWRVVSFDVRGAADLSSARTTRTIADRRRRARTSSTRVKADHEATLAYVRRPVGKTSAPLYSYFALVADDPSVQIVSQAQTWYIKDMLKGTEYKDLPVLSAAAPFKAGGRGGAGLLHRRSGRRRRDQERRRPLSLSRTRCRRWRSPARRCKEWLEMSAGIFNQIEPGKADQPLINPDFPSYNFDVIDGVTYKIDLSQPPKYDPKGKP